MAGSTVKIVVGPRRKDGKHRVTLVYPISGKRLVKIWTPAQIEEERASLKKHGLLGSDTFGRFSWPLVVGLAVGLLALVVTRR